MIIDSPFMLEPLILSSFSSSLLSCVLLFSSGQFSSVAQSCPTLCAPMNHSTPGLPVHHQLPEFTQTHVHRVGDAIQPSHPLSSPSPPAPNPSQHHTTAWKNGYSLIPKLTLFAQSSDFKRKFHQATL